MNTAPPFRLGVSLGGLCLLMVAIPSTFGQLIVNGGNFIVLNANGQAMIDMGGATATGFTVRKVSAPIADAMEEFARYSEKGEWEKAFATLPSVTDSPTSGLVAGADGFYMPLRTRFRQLLAGVSPAGREAYRIFNDAQAAQALSELENATDPDSGGVANEVARLQELFDKYFITTVGDRIGDRLGDAKYEAGDFAGAAEVWESILTDFPDLTLPAQRLHAKRAIALARARRWDDFKVEQAYIRDKFPGMTTRLGTKDVPVGPLLEEMATSMPAAGTARPVDGSGPLPIRFPTSDTPLWQCIVTDDQLQAELDRTARLTGLGNSANLLTMVGPQVAADDERIYLNWFGIGMAIDAQTGKMLWRTGPFSDLTSKLQTAVSMGFDPVEDQAILLLPEKGRLILVGPSQSTRSVVQANGGVVVRAGSGQMAMYPTTGGKAVWSSETTGLTTWSLIGTPLLDGDTIYIAARSLVPVAGSSSNTMEMNLLAVDANNGRLLWPLPLGTMTSQLNNRGQAVMPKPMLLRAGEMIYVQTGNSAVVAVNAQARRVEWAYCFAPPAQQGQANQPANAPVVRAVYQQVDPLQFPSSMAISPAGLLVKDRSSATLHLIDVDHRSLKWTRPVDSSSAIAAADETSVYLLGRQLDCIDLGTKDLRWSSKTPGVFGGTDPLVIGSRMYVFGARGIYDLDLTSGQAKIFYGWERDSFGGTIRRVGDKLICISNRSVTAYPLPAQ